LTSELSGNVIDLCPVGALTSKPYAFNARPWELDHAESIDVMDAVGSNIRVDSRRGAVLRVLPTINDTVNEEWITDKARFNWDGLARQRLDKPYIRENGKLRAAGWDEALAVVSEKLSGEPETIAAITGDLCDAESMKALKDLMESLGVKNIAIDGIEGADAVLIIGANPRLEASLVNTRLRKAWIEGGMEIGLIGDAEDLTYEYEHLGTNPADIVAFMKKTKGFAKAFKAAKNPAIILGAGALNRADTPQILKILSGLAKKVNLVREGWNGLNILRLSTHEILDAAQQGAVKTVFLMGADELDTSKLKDAFVIYQGSHGDAGAHVADVILPGAAYSEKDGLYVNLEGRVQMGTRAVAPKGEAKEDWAIIRATRQARRTRLNSILAPSAKTVR